MTTITFASSSSSSIYCKDALFRKKKNFLFSNYTLRTDIYSDNTMETLYAKENQSACPQSAAKQQLLFNKQCQPFIQQWRLLLLLLQPQQKLFCCCCFLFINIVEHVFNIILLLTRLLCITYTLAHNNNKTKLQKNFSMAFSCCLISSMHSLFV